MGALEKPLACLGNGREVGFLPLLGREFESLGQFGEFRSGLVCDDARQLGKCFNNLWDHECGRVVVSRGKGGCDECP